MSKKYTPAIFQPTLRPSWGGALSYIAIEEKSKILEAIINYPKTIEINSRFWEETIKPDLDTQYETFVETCQAKGRGAKSYWEKMGKDKYNISYTDDKDMDNISIARDNHKDNSLKDKDKDKDKDKIKNNRYGECKNVLLTEEQYNKLSSEHKNLNQAIEKLDTWLGTSGGKNKNKNHFAYFKSNSWVWENLKPDAFELYTMLAKKSKIPDEVYIDSGSFYLDNTFDEFKDMTDDECDSCAKWLLDKFRCQTLPRDRFVKIVRRFKGNEK